MFSPGLYIPSTGRSPPYAETSKLFSKDGEMKEDCASSPSFVYSMYIPIGSFWFASCG